MKQSVQLLPLSELRPAGYPLVLHLLQPFHSLLLVTTLQHLMGIALGVVIYAVLRDPRAAGLGRDARRRADAVRLAADLARVLDPAGHLVHAGADDRRGDPVVRPKPAIWQAVIVGLLVSWASVIRGNGAPVFVIILAFLLVMRVGWKVFTACLAAFVVPLAAYALIFFSEHGQLNITDSTGLFLWSRTMLFANCAVIKPPPSLVPLCPENQPGHPAAPAPAWSVPAMLGERTPADYLWAAGAWYRVDAHPGVNAYNNKLAMQFAERAIVAQPAGLPQDGGQGGAGDLLRHRPADRLPGHAVHRGPARQPDGRVHAVLGEPVRARPLQHARGPAVGVPHVLVPAARLVPRVGLLPGDGGRAGPADPPVARLGAVRGPGLGRRGRQPGAADRGARTRLPVRDLRGPVRLPGARPDVHPQAGACGLPCLRLGSCLVPGLCPRTRLPSHGRHAMAHAPARTGRPDPARMGRHGARGRRRRHRAGPVGLLPGRRRPAARPRRAAVGRRADPDRRRAQGRRPVPDPGRGRPAARRWAPRCAARSRTSAGPR